MVNLSIMCLYIVMESFSTQLQKVKMEILSLKVTPSPGRKKSVLALKIWFILAD